MSKLFLIFSILFNTFGFSGATQKIDTNYISQTAGTAQSADAASLSAALPDILIYPIVNKNSPAPKIYASNYILVDNDSGEILTSLKPNERVPIASTTKIMTAIIALEKYSLDDIATVQPDAIKTVANDGAIPDFYANERMKIRDLLWCMLMNSSNVAAYTLAEHLNSGKETGISKFVAAMNAKARDFEMKDTNYRDPAGLDSTGYSSAYDLTVVTKQALKNSLFAEIVKTKTATVYDVDHRDVHPLNNSNRLVNDWNYPGAIGVKTGFMPDTPDQPGAGHTLVAAVQRNGHTLISVILNTVANTPTASAEESRKIQDWGWANVSWQ